MLDDDFPASFALALAAKDARLAAEAAEGHGADLPMLRAIAERFAQAHGGRPRRRGHGRHLPPLAGPLELGEPTLEEPALGLGGASSSARS